MNTENEAAQARARYPLGAVLRRGSYLAAVLSLCAALVAPLLPAAGQEPQVAAEPSSRVLLLGNSYTRFNVLPLMLRRVAEAAGVSLPTESVARGGYTLRRHWRVHETRARVRSGRYSHVVLQGHSLRPIDRRAEFEDYTARFAQAVREAGGEPILYETWPRHPGAPLYREHAELRTPPQMASRVGEAYRALAVRHGARVAPVGRAFLTALTTRPELEIYKPDGAHPTWAGSYLAACVLFGAITGQDPRESHYTPWELPPASARAARELAALVLEAERSAPPPPRPAAREGAGNPPVGVDPAAPEAPPAVF